MAGLFLCVLVLTLILGSFMCDYLNLIDRLIDPLFILFFILLWFMLFNQDKSYEGRWYDAFLGFVTILINKNYLNRNGKIARIPFIIVTILIISFVFLKMSTDC